MGYLLDTRGPRACTCGGLVFVIAGSMLIAFGDEHSFNAFAPGLALMGLGGSGACTRPTNGTRPTASGPLQVSGVATWSWSLRC